MMRFLSRAMLASLAAALITACGASAPAAPTTAPTAAPTSAPASTATPKPPAEPTEAPTVAPTAPPADAPTATVAAEPAAGASFAPAKRSVWETTVGPDQLKGDCPNGSIVPPYGPVLITPKPETGGFDWRDVQNATYGFAPTAANTFAYAGPNGRKDGVITMTVTFVDAANFTMQAEYVKADAPGCVHGYDYKGVYKFDR